ncbi:MAG: hypothetical protein M4579_005864 [Chaenotheca gracillima]|nr:MAG: hypothetical protein M4579_005864 [Chaenotheca gracillima]
MAASTPAVRAQNQPPPDYFIPPADGTPPEQRFIGAMHNSHQANATQPRGGQHGRNRVSGDHRHLAASSTAGAADGNGALPVPFGQNASIANGQPRNGHGAGGAGRLDGPRSPPGSKNTSHVPCKFFNQGTCQAGKACPFSHSRDAAMTQAPCKYFAKGNCKYGQGCLLAHVLPDGRRVNRPHVAPGGSQLNIGGRVNPESYHNQGSALANSLMQAQLVTGPYGSQYQYPPQEEYSPVQGPGSRSFDKIPTIDTSFSSHPGSKYGSPREEGRLPLSPAIKGLSALDAPLPASFDSNGISWIARNGPVAASVPSKFGLDSLPPSFKDGQSDALKHLHDSAFGNDTRSKAGQATSPPSVSGDYMGQRIMHSQRNSKPKIMSASLPRAGPTGEDWDEFAFEEDFIPNSLHELLTPQEKKRRFSRNAADEDNSSRLSTSGVGTPGEASSKAGSPATSSPSRFGPLFTRYKKEEESPAPTSSVGHVGSPLRNSTLEAGSPNQRAPRRPTSGDVSPYFASPPRQSSMSMISQQLQRARLSSGAGDSGLHPGSSARPLNGRLDRAVSSSSISNGRFVSSIDEEQSEVFSMDEEADGKRHSGGWGYPVGGRSSPHFGPIGGGRSTSSAGSQSRARDHEKETKNGPDEAFFESGG